MFYERDRQLTKQFANICGKIVLSEKSSTKVCGHSKTKNRDEFVKDETLDPKAPFSINR